MNQIEHTRSEAKILSNVQYAFIVNLWGTFQDTRNLYMVMESADVNKTGLRIDELANDTDQGGSITTLVSRAQEWVAAHLADVATARA